MNKKAMKVKVISDGSGLGTRVINTETGEVIPNIYKIEWACEAGGFARITLYCLGEAEIEAVTEIVEAKQ